MVKSPNAVALQPQVDATKSSAAILDYAFNWSAVINASESITGSTWAVSSTDLTVVSDSTSGTITTAFISGGKDGYYYELKNTITTDQSRTFVRIFTLGVQAK